MAFPIDMTNIECYLEDARPPGSAGVIPTLVLQPRNGFVPQKFNKGYPEVREVTEKRSAQNGTYDFTEFFGARGVTLEVKLASELQDDPLIDDEALEDMLRRWMVPNVRAHLYVRTSPTQAWRRIHVRPSSANSSLSFIRHADFRSVSLAWKGIDGVMESGDLHSIELQPSTTVETGRAYDKVFDYTYGASAVIGAQNVINEGTVDSFPTITVYGPVTGIRIENQTSGKSLNFLAAYALIAGEYLVIDFEEGTVSMSGDVTNSRYDKLDFATGGSEWWTLVPGLNSIRYWPITSADPSRAVIEWRDNFA